MSDDRAIDRDKRPKARDCPRFPRPGIRVIGLMDAGRELSNACSPLVADAQVDIIPDRGRIAGTTIAAGGVGGGAILMGTGNSADIVAPPIAAPERLDTAVPAGLAVAGYG